MSPGAGSSWTVCETPCSSRDNRERPEASSHGHGRSRPVTATVGAVLTLADHPFRVGQRRMGRGPRRNPQSVPHINVSRVI